MTWTRIWRSKKNAQRELLRKFATMRSTLGSVGNVSLRAAQDQLCLSFAMSSGVVRPKAWWNIVRKVLHRACADLLILVLRRLYFKAIAIAPFSRKERKSNPSLWYIFVQVPQVLLHPSKLTSRIEMYGSQDMVPLLLVHTGSLSSQPCSSQYQARSKSWGLATA